MRSSSRSRIHYGWFVVIVAFLAMLGAAGVRSTPGVLILPLEHEFGWQRSVVSLAVSINLVLFGLIGPFAAALMERVGMRKVMTGALLLMAAAVAMTTQMKTAWHLYLLWGVLVGAGSGTLSGWVAATVATRWFVSGRGVVVGILTVANATGQLIFLPSLARITDAAGWRLAALTVSGAMLIVVPLILLVIRNHPQDMGLAPYGAPLGTVTPVAPPAVNPVKSAMDTLKRCIRHRDFLLLSGTFFICGASTNGLIGTHLIPASHDHGMPEVVAASLLATIGIFDVIGTLGSGWLSDRFDSRKLLGWYYGLRGLSLLLLPYAYEAGISAIAIFVVFYGLDWVATVPPTVRLAADIFGKENVGRVYSWVFAAHQMGSAAIAYSAGALRQWTGSYTPAFLLAGTLCLIGASMALRIERPVLVDPVAVAAD